MHPKLLTCVEYSYKYTENPRLISVDMACCNHTSTWIVCMSLSLTLVVRELMTSSPFSWSVSRTLESSKASGPEELLLTTTSKPFTCGCTITVAGSGLGKSDPVFAGSGFDLYLRPVSLLSSSLLALSSLIRVSVSFMKFTAPFTWSETALFPYT